MKIELSSNYKSLTPFISEELPNFTVIIGKNGNGKSQLVQKFSELEKAKTQYAWNKGEYEIENRLSTVAARLYPNVPNDTIELLKVLST